MLTEHEIYLHEQLTRLAREQATKAPWHRRPVGPQRQLLRASARFGGQLLLSLAVRLLAYGGVQAGLTPYVPSPGYSQN